jgi:hypothetical protein
MLSPESCPSNKKGLPTCSHIALAEEPGCIGHPQLHASLTRLWVAGGGSHSFRDSFSMQAMIYFRDKLAISRYQESSNSAS